MEVTHIWTFFSNIYAITVSNLATLHVLDTVFTKMCEKNVQMCVISIKNESHLATLHVLDTVFIKVVPIVFSILMKNDVVAKITFLSCLRGVH